MKQPSAMHTNVHWMNGNYFRSCLRGSACVPCSYMSNDQKERRNAQNRRKMITRIVVVVLAVAMFASLVIPAVISGL